ncbi:MAG: carbon starvation protein A, partial [Gemmatimonadaceae bacterium]|nr:carbon starvation protein A [Gemmatimonadaceae bacterium]
KIGVVAALGTTVESAATAIRNWGFTVSPAELSALAAQVGEKSLLSRVGGAPSLAVGMAHLFSNALGGGAMALWYHFAIMFEALFILTTLDAGTRVGRFMLQDIVKHAWAPLGRRSWYPGVVITSALFVAMWGYFLYQGVLDPLGGINSLWPLFGISNQLLAAVALCVGTTVIIRMGRGRWAWTTLVPLSWLVIVTLTAGWQKLFSPDPALGFLAKANALGRGMAAGILPTGRTAAEVQRMIFNERLDAAVAAFFLFSVVVIFADSTRSWISLWRGGAPARSTETPPEFDTAATLGGRATAGAAS